MIHSDPFNRALVAVVTGVAALAVLAACTPPPPAPLVGIVQVAAGTEHSCALDQSGAVFCWGNNWAGQLGDGTYAARSRAVRVAGVAGAVQIAAGYGHTCALIADGTTKCWGDNYFGQLGNGETLSGSPLPVQVQGLDGASAIDLGARHSCAIIASGSVKCWGSNFYGQLGTGSVDKTLPGGTGVASLVLDVADAQFIAAGGNHSCAALRSGLVKCWGNNDSGELGRGYFTATEPYGIGGASVVDSLFGVQAISDTSGGHTCAAVTGGTARCWGANGSGQLGTGNISSQRPFGIAAAVEVSGLSDVVQLTAGYFHTCSISISSRLSCWGANELGQLGLGQNGTTPSLEPTELTSLSGVTGSSAGYVHTCVVLDTGHVRRFGSNEFGQLGNGTFTHSMTPVEVVR
jgi:alpha-tubulin suppressor-like RCC1 family protein